MINNPSPSDIIFMIYLNLIFSIRTYQLQVLPWLTDWIIGKRSLCRHRDSQRHSRSLLPVPRLLWCETFTWVWFLRRLSDSVGTWFNRKRHYCFVSLEHRSAGSYVSERPMANTNNIQEFIHLLWRNHSLKSQIYHRDCDCSVVWRRIRLEDWKRRRAVCHRQRGKRAKELEWEGNLMNSALCVIRGLTKQAMTSKQW